MYFSKTKEGEPFMPSFPFCWCQRQKKKNTKKNVEEREKVGGINPPLEKGHHDEWGDAPWYAPLPRNLKTYLILLEREEGQVRGRVSVKQKRGRREEETLLAKALCTDFICCICPLAEQTRSPSPIESHMQHFLANPYEYMKSYNIPNHVGREYILAIVDDRSRLVQYTLCSLKLKYILLSKIF